MLGGFLRRGVGFFFFFDSFVYYYNLFHAFTRGAFCYGMGGSEHTLYTTHETDLYSILLYATLASFLVYLLVPCCCRQNVPGVCRGLEKRVALWRLSLTLDQAGGSERVARVCLSLFLPLPLSDPGKTLGRADSCSVVVGWRAPTEQDFGMVFA